MKRTLEPFRVGWSHFRGPRLRECKQASAFHFQISKLKLTLTISLIITRLGGGGGISLFKILSHG